MLCKLVDEDSNEITAANPLNVTSSIDGATIMLPVDMQGHQLTNAEALPVKDAPIRGTIAAHRAAIATADKVVTGTITAADQAGVVGVMAASEHKVAYAPGNTWGSAGISAIVAVTPTINKTVDVTIAQITGATYYDIFFSTDAAPKWVGRVTEAQRASGIAITAVGVTGAGGSAGVVNVRLVGTGLASTASKFAANNAYRPDNAGIVAVDCTGKKQAVVTIDYSDTGARVAPALSLVPFFYDATTWFQGEADTVYIEAGSVGQGKKQIRYVDVEAVSGFKMLVGSIAGTGGSVNIGVQLV